MKKIDLTYKFMKDMDEIYSHPPFNTPAGDWKCPVCGGVYDDRADLQIHMERRTCHDFGAMIRDTELEDTLYNVFKDIYPLLNGAAYRRRIPTLSEFRRAKAIDVLVKVWVFAEERNVSFKEYLEFLLRKIRSFSELEDSIGPSYINAFFRWRRTWREPKLVTKFVIRNLAKLKQDPEFLISSLVRGDITYKHFKDKFMNDFFLDQLTDVQLEYLNSVLKMEFNAPCEYDEWDVRNICLT